MLEQVFGYAEGDRFELSMRDFGDGELLVVRKRPLEHLAVIK